jgi:hypothetical protein
MTTAQLAALAATPIVLDLNGDGIHTTAAAQGVNFDLNANGQAHKVGWVDSTDGLLAFDRNGDGVINNGSELFGSATQTATGKAANGFAAMASMDSNGDGVLNALDVNWDKLKVWVDANHNGVTDAGELKSLSAYGITSLNLHADAGTVTDHGNFLGMTSNYTTADGASHAMADVWFANAHGGTQAATATAAATTAAAPTLSDLLSPTTAEVPGLTSQSVTAAVVPPVSHDLAHAQVLPIDRTQQDEHRHLPLL